MRAGVLKPLMDRLHAFLVDQQPLHLPRAPWPGHLVHPRQLEGIDPLPDDARLPPDNNRSEARTVIGPRREELPPRRTRRPARNRLVCNSLTATCDANGFNPLAYLTDVLAGSTPTPAIRLEELLPHLWRPPDHPVTPPSPADSHRDHWGWGLRRRSGTGLRFAVLERHPFVCKVFLLWRVAD